MIRMTSLVAGLSLLDAVQAWHYVAQYFGLGFLEIPAMIAFALVSAAALWVTIAVTFWIVGKACLWVAEGMSTCAQSVNRKFRGFVGGVAAKVWKWAKRNKK